MTTKTKTTKKLEKVTLTVTTATMGTRTAEWYGKDAKKTADFYRALWQREGHVVVDG